ICAPLRPSTTVALPVLPLPRFLKRSMVCGGFLPRSQHRPRRAQRRVKAGAGETYFRSSAITRTMRSALAEDSGAPASFRTDTVDDSPWLRTTIRYLRGGVAVEELNSLPKKPGSFLSGLGAT